MTTTTAAPKRRTSPKQAAPLGPFSFHLARVSGNVKTGPIPVTTTSNNTCPPNCSFKGNGCYAEGGPLAIHWRKVSEHKRGYSLDELCADIKTFRRNALWRHNQAGDLVPRAPGEIDGGALMKIAIANKGRRGFTYSHYAPTPHNRAQIRAANLAGFTVNLSAENLAQADEYAALGVAPVVVTLPADATKATKTPAGRHVIVCPAVTGNTDCLNCGICQQRDRQAIVGFPAHGRSATKVQAIFFMERQK